MERARSHQRLFSALAFGLLALVAELAGRSVTHRVDLGSHVATPSYAHADYYPILLVVVKVGIALLLARLLWRVMKARSTEAAGSGCWAVGRTCRGCASSSPRGSGSRSSC